MPCIRKCCPHDQEFNVIGDQVTCDQADSDGSQYIPNFHLQTESDLMRNEDYLVVGPEAGQVQHFCSPGSFLVGLLDSQLFVNGSVKGIADSFESKHFTEFCVESFNESYKYFVCYSEEPPPCGGTRKTLHSTFLCISVVFLLLTLAVYLIEPSLRKQYLFSRIIMAFMINLTLTYFILVTQELSPADQGTLGNFSCE